MDKNRWLSELRECILSGFIWPGYTYTGARSDRYSQPVIDAGHWIGRIVIVGALSGCGGFDIRGFICSRYTGIREGKRPVTGLYRARIVGPLPG